MAAFAPTPPGAWAPPARGVAAARAVAPPPQRSLPRRGLAYPLTPIPRATTTTAALKADTFAPPRFYDFAPDAVAAVRLRHVQVETEALARVAFGLVKSGDKSLAELAASLSTDATSRAAGGDLGWWDPHEGVAANPAGGLLDPAVAAAAVGAVAAPSPLPRSPPAALLAEATRVRPNTLQLVESPAGWHVFVVEDARHALRPTLKLPPRAADAFRHKAGAKAGARNGTGSGAGIPPTTPMSYHITTLGCAMNEADSERMAAELESAGYAPVDDAQTAAVVVWNTCSIRDHAEQKVYSALGRHAARKWAAMGDVTLVVAGCVAQQEGSKLLRRVPEVDLVLGPQYANRLGELLDDVRTNGVQVVATEPVHVSEDLTKPRRGSGTTAWVNVIYGCLERYVGRHGGGGADLVDEPTAVCGWLCGDWARSIEVPGHFLTCSVRRHTGCSCSSFFACHLLPFPCACVGVHIVCSCHSPVGHRTRVCTGWSSSASLAPFVGCTQPMEVRQLIMCLDSRAVVLTIFTLFVLA